MRKIQPLDLVRWPDGKVQFVKQLTATQSRDGGYEVVSQDSPEYDLLVEELADAENERMAAL